MTLLQLEKMISEGEYFLAEDHSDYADEFNIFSIAVFTRDELIKWLEAIKQAVPFRCGFGTNEATEYRDVAEVLYAMKVQVATEEEYKVLKKFLSCSYKGSIGTGWVLDTNSVLDKVTDKFVPAVGEKARDFVGYFIGTITEEVTPGVWRVVDDRGEERDFQANQLTHHWDY